MSKVNTAAVVSDQSFGFQAPAKEQAPVITPPPATNEQDFRLVIEEDEATGAFIYKTMDRRTGEVIQQFPRDSVLKMKETDQYSAGSLVNARA